MHEGPRHRQWPVAAGGFEEEVGKCPLQVFEVALPTRRDGCDLQVGRGSLVECDESLSDKAGVNRWRGGVAGSESHPHRAAGMVVRCSKVGLCFDGEAASLNSPKFFGTFLLNVGHDSPGYVHGFDMRRSAGWSTRDRFGATRDLQQSDGEILQLLKGPSHCVVGGPFLRPVRSKYLLQSTRVCEICLVNDDTDVCDELQ